MTDVIHPDPPPVVRFAPRRLAHVNLYVGDLAAATAFYRDVCGLRQVFDEDEIEAVFFSNGNTHHDLAIIRAGTPVLAAQGRGLTPGLNHLGFEMENEVELVDGAARAREHGAGIVRASDHTISRSVYLLDADGLGVEVYADAAEDWRETYRRIEGTYMTSPWDPDTVDHPSDAPNYEVDPPVDVVDDALVHPVRLGRAALRVSDLERAASWYERVLGLDVLDTTADRVVLAGRLGHPDLTLVPAGDAGPGLHSFGLELASIEEVEASRARLAAAGVAAADTDDGIVVTDPDGQRVELYAAA